MCCPDIAGPIVSWQGKPPSRDRYCATIVGTKLSDTIKGTGEADYIFGFEGSDSIFGQGGNDDIKGGGGADFLDGGAGFDTAHYEDSTSGVSVNLLSSFGLGGTAEGDSYASIEKVVGSM
jgi:Ca2+-binding RTX toxin-like protein